MDNGRCYRCLGDNVIPYGAPPLNTFGFHIEQCGHASWTRRRWLLSHRNTVRRCAYKAALRCLWYRIPPRLLDVAALEADFGVDVRGGVPEQPGPLHGGIVTHATVSAAYHETDHTDPGDGYPLDVFLKDLTDFLGTAKTRRLLAPPGAVFA